MYIRSEILAELFGSTPLVGWKEDYDPEGFNLDSEMMGSSSGRYFQASHPMVTLRNVMSTAPRIGDYNYPDWANDQDYTVGQIREYDSTNYRCILAHEVADEGAQQPDSSPTYWKAWTLDDEKNRWLKEKTEEYILSTIDDFFDAKEMNGSTKSLLEQRAIFDDGHYEGMNIENEGKTVGFEIRALAELGIMIRVSQIGLQFTENGTVTVKLYHSSKKDPVSSHDFSYTGSGSLQWFDLAIDLNYLSTHGVGGSWTLEYDQSTIPGQAINKAYLWTTGSLNNYASFKLWSRFVDFHPFTISTSDREKPSKRAMNYSSNFGLNLVVSAHCDHTDFIKRQKDMFANMLIYGVGQRFLREIILNPESRVNNKEAGVNYNRQELIYEIDGNPQGRPTGIGKKYKDSLNAASLSMEGISQHCLSCNKKRGVRRKSIG